MIHCMKCKERTPDVGENVVSAGGRTRMTATCGKCGGKKSQFIKSAGILPGEPFSNFVRKGSLSRLRTSRRQSGGADIHAQLSQEAYTDQSANNVDGDVLDTQLSTKKTQVYHNPEKNDTVVSHRGTKPSDKNDLKNDALITLGILNKNTSKRVKNATEISKKAESKYTGSKVTQAGHSLGGAVAKEVGKNMSVNNSSVEAYNAGASPLDIVKNTYNKVKCSVSNSNDCKRLKKQTDNLTVVDPISISNLSSVGKKNIVAPSSLNTHSLSNFTQKGGCASMKDCPCEKRQRGRPKKM